MAVAEAVGMDDLQRANELLAEAKEWLERQWAARDLVQRIGGHLHEQNAKRPPDYSI